MNKREAASILRVSERTLTDWQSRGMPYQAGGPGRDGEYDPVAIVEWARGWGLGAPRSNSVGVVLERPEAPSSGRERLSIALARKHELELEKQEGKLVELDTVERTWVNLLTHTRTRLLAMPASREIPDAVKPVLVRLIDAALRELAEHDPASLVHVPGRD